jgi:hypothetical protein
MDRKMRPNTGQAGRCKDDEAERGRYRKEEEVETARNRVDLRI